ncbi:MAG: toll/interleukin-1 receptor domain-containing protein [Thermodesulfobacteriota bacterium]|nr:toll/interleukin-1 receptor domain-containing protein [Thermodesulfobacteriota bacterium]
MALDLDKKSHIYRLNDTVDSFLQVLLPEFILRKSGSGVELDITIGDDVNCIRSSEGKRALFDAVEKKAGSAKRRIIVQRNRFYKDKDLLAYRFDCRDYPFRYANGGVLPIVRLKSKENGIEDYFCLPYRDIFPIGWNIANGASDNREELLQPQMVVEREFNEELLVVDDEEKLIYFFDPDSPGETQRSRNESLKAWSQRFKGRKLEEYERLHIPIKWIEGPDRISVTSGERRHSSDGYFISVTPEDNAIELDMIAYINLSGNVSFFDGELSKLYDDKSKTYKVIPVNRIIGLFSVKKFTRRSLQEKEFLPDRVFFDCREWESSRLQEVIDKHYFPAAKALRGGEPQVLYHKARYKFDLCPITREIISRYLDWTRDEKKALRSERRRPVKRGRGRSAPSEVFISYKSEDGQIARWMYDYLSNKGLCVFLSAESLPKMGESNYAKAIDKALDEAKFMVVLGTKAEFFDSGWVGYEWRSFYNEIRSGRKRDGQLFTFSSGIETHALPYALRSVQNIPCSPLSPSDAFENLHEYIADQNRERRRSR